MQNLDDITLNTCKCSFYLKIFSIVANLLCYFHLIGELGLWEGHIKARLIVSVHHH